MKTLHVALAASMLVAGLAPGWAAQVRRGGSPSSGGAPAGMRVPAGPSLGYRRLELFRADKGLQGSVSLPGAPTPILSLSEDHTRDLAHLVEVIPGPHAPSDGLAHMMIHYAGAQEAEFTTGEDLDPDGAGQWTLRYRDADEAAAAAQALSRVHRLGTIKVQWSVFERLKKEGGFLESSRRLFERLKASEIYGLSTFFDGAVPLSQGSVPIPAAGPLAGRGSIPPGGELAPSVPGSPIFRPAVPKVPSPRRRGLIGAAALPFAPALAGADPGIAVALIGALVLLGAFVVMALSSNREEDARRGALETEFLRLPGAVSVRFHESEYMIAPYDSVRDEYLRIYFTDQAAADAAWGQFPAEEVRRGLRRGGRIVQFVARRN